MLKNTSLFLGTLALLSSLLVTTPGRASEQPGEMSSFAQRKDAFIKIKMKAPSGFTLPTVDPSMTSNVLKVFVNGGVLVDDLTAGTWVPLGSSASPRGYRYTHREAPTSGPCKTVVVREKMISALCRATGTIPLPLEAGGNSDVVVKLIFDGETDVYCGRAQPPHRREVGQKLIKARRQPAPVSCVCPDGIDTDFDGLYDCVETNTGTFAGPTDTGTDPNDPDTDGDSISDGDEVNGTNAGLDLPGMGANPLRQNILIEYDWFDDSLGCGAHSHQPTQAMIERVSNAFAGAPTSNPNGTTGITIISDYGQGGLFDGGNLVSDADGVLAGGVNNAEFKNHKNANFDANRHGYFHYVLLPHRYNTTSSSSGQAEFPGDDMIVSLYCAGSTRNVANTIMHELGHNLNLGHGGSWFTHCNWKPNYNSVMNYKYQFGGVDNDCDSTPDNVLDYSIGDRIDLDENNLIESHGTCGAGGVPIDWNENGSVDGGTVSHDINFLSNATDQAINAALCAGALSTLTDHDDWAAIELSGLSDADGAHKRQVQIIDCENPAPMP